MLTYIVLTLTVAHVLAGPTFKKDFKIKQSASPPGLLVDIVDGLTGKGEYKLSYADYQETWESFKSTYNRDYQNEEEERRRYGIFMETVKLIEQHNLRYHNGESTFYLGLTQFADLTSDESRARNGFRSERARNLTTTCTSYEPSTKSVPESVNWASKGYVTEAKNQGLNCGSCWAFGTIGSVEGQWFKKTGNLVSLSEQQLMDCSSSYGNNGCDGGYIDPTFQYIIDAGAVQAESTYPYEAKDDTCRFDKTKPAATMSSCQDVAPSGSEDALKVAVANIGPISVAIDASHTTFKHYTGGVYDNPDCSQEYLDHCVLVVGYGSADGQDYWIIKNSWGKNWGYKGFVLMSRNKNNQCGIASQASFPLA